VKDQRINYNFVKPPMALKGKTSHSRVAAGITAKE
jgi:hypothetical protein